MFKWLCNLFKKKEVEKVEEKPVRKKRAPRKKSTTSKKGK